MTGICLQYKTPSRIKVPVFVFNIICPMATTEYIFRESTDRVMSASQRQLNRERFPTTECVARESNNALFCSKAGTTPISEMDALFWFNLVLAFAASALVRQSGTQCPILPQ
ncbi:hypothetical protein O181_034953 [Austropuccinia psidii MF-1]|uniref:Uncharacterized protein n=1 Tax=Austropuccinia psidii MF-1 TaxID=1389203 RepID=A0A9Q3D6I6_9BASI|nr:hypothetical protein [Austropuccinia psidii MF-1]